MSTRFTRYFLFTASLAALAGLAHAAHSTSGEDEAALRAQTTSWAKAHNAGDAAGVAAQYTEDALLFPPNAPVADGKAAILAYFSKEVAAAKSAGVMFNISPKTDVGVSGDMGWESGTYTATINGTVVEAGKFLSVSRKTSGKWRYIRDIWNADGPAAAAK